MDESLPTQGESGDSRENVKVDKSTLLDFLQEADRPILITRLIDSLQPGDESRVHFAASLVAQQADEALQDALIVFLDSSIISGKGQAAFSTSIRHPELGNKLLDRAADFLGENRDVRDKEDKVLSYLRFCSATLSHLPATNVHGMVFLACLDLLHDESADVCYAAKEVVFSLLVSSDLGVREEIVNLHGLEIWSRIEALVTFVERKPQALLGYSLWLRWLMSQPPYADGFLNETYWELLLQGLRQGDSEQRKMCLAITRISVSADWAKATDDVREQYERYCTVFETIVLGRYINQVQECNNDLNSLASAESQLGTQWLYTLLGAALENKMQDSNRKFIGTWVLESDLKVTPDFVEFFARDFLPWATQGHLFVSSLKRIDGIIRCLHGERLTAVVSRLLSRQDGPSEVREVIVKHITTARPYIYSEIYLLEGLDTGDQSLQDMYSSRGIPPVARAYVDYRLPKLGVEVAPAQPSKRERMENATLEKCRAFNPDEGNMDDIWSDLEYLELPKSVLMLMPDTILTSAMVTRCASDTAEAAKVADKAHSLLKIAATKAFLFPRLIATLRTTTMTTPIALQTLNMTELCLSIGERPPELLTDLLLEETIVPLTPHSYDHFFGERLSYGFAAYLDLVSRLAGHQDVVSSLLLHLTRRWKEQKNPPPTVSSWKNTLQLQVLVLCCEQYQPDGLEHMKELVKSLQFVLAIEPLPQYRYLLEWAIVRLYFRFPELKPNILVELSTKDHHSNPKYVASLMKLGATLARFPDTSEAFTLEMAKVFVPLAASSKVVIRHEAQWQVPLLMDHASHKNWTKITDNPALIALDDYIRSLERFTDPPPERVLGKFDPIADHTMTNLVEGLWFDLDATAQAPLTRREDFVKLQTPDTTSSLSSPCIPLGEPIVGPPTLPTPPIDSLALSSPSPQPPQTTPDSTSRLALQTKGQAALLASLSTTTGRPTRPHPTVTICASLLTNPHNLGGLSRLTETLGFGSLTLPNLTVTSSPAFTSVSVSSHAHVPLLPVSAASLPAWLVERQRAGDTVVGIEQTDRSVMLGSEGCVLPEKCVLVVGSEREGIPGAVLAGCDLLVEIPQGGLTRSLNVQTAMAVVGYEWVRQHRGGRRG